MSGITTARCGLREASAWRSVVTLDSHERRLTDPVRPAAEVLERVGVGAQRRPFGVESAPCLAARQTPAPFLVSGALGRFLVEPQRLGIESHRVDVLGSPATDE